DVSFNVGEATVGRRDRQREVTVLANVIEGEASRAVMKVNMLPAARPDTQKAVPPSPVAKAIASLSGKPEPKAKPAGELPSDVQIVAGGQTEEMVEFMKMFGLAMLWGLLLVYGVLVLLFKDFYQPITILTAFPLSIGGAFVGLLVTQQPFSLFVGIGLI